eukprot:gb/GEZN01003554.1/.p1 GENE.gb/GEZN01003554.1/~~gb/GEZN01003554.1/.p1  ORF type:complete len:584 (-),score=59.10 gb/GEZN01003554.1/:206-1957(-)
MVFRVGDWTVRHTRLLLSRHRQLGNAKLACRGGVTCAAILIASSISSPEPLAAAPADPLSPRPLTLSAPSWRGASLWMEQALAEESPDRPLRPQLEGKHIYDVVIVGAGFTGLWTAYYLQKNARSPLRIAVVEAETVGYGASGRNGGWLMPSLAGLDSVIANQTGEVRHETWQLVQGIVDEVKAVVEREGISCDLAKGGYVQVAARYPEQGASLEKELIQLESLGGCKDFGHGEPTRWLEESEVIKILPGTPNFGALYSANMATIHPARLVRGLACVLESKSSSSQQDPQNGCVHIYERSRVEHWEPGLVETAKGSVAADWVVLAVEGYAPSLQGATSLGKFQIPIQSLVIATQPLPDKVWDECIGLQRGQCFSDSGRLVTYGIRSSDNRLVFGMRGTYEFSGIPRKDFTLTREEKDSRYRMIHQLFPRLAEQEVKVTITHAWGGNLGMSRRMMPHMFIDKKNQVLVAGGYMGEGVGASNLSGRTLTALMLQATGNAKLGTQEGEAAHKVLIYKPWVVQGDITSTSQSGLMAWEPEPIPWLGYKLVSTSQEIENSVLSNPNSPPWLRNVVIKLADLSERILSG